MPGQVSFLLLLVTANTFMTMAWYGHLKNTRQPLLLAIIASWMIALAEYCFQVPANRIGSRYFSLTQLKITQECVTLAVFLIYAFLVFRETPRWNTLASMCCIVAAVTFAFLGGPPSKPPARLSGSETSDVSRGTPPEAPAPFPDTRAGELQGGTSAPPASPSQLDEGAAS